MYLIVDKNTGKIVTLNSCISELDDFVFDSLDECVDYFWDDENIHLENVLIVKVDKFYKPDMSFSEVKDGSIW